MKVSTIASAIALCILSSPALASPLDARDVRTSTKTKTVTKTETETVELPRKTKSVTETVTETVTLPRKTKTVYSTSIETALETITKLKSASTVTVSKSASTITLTQSAPASTISVHLPASTVTLTQRASASTISVQLPASTTTLTQRLPASTTSVQLPASTVTLTQRLPASTTSIQLPASTITVPSTKIITTSVPLTKSVTTTSTVSLPRVTITEPATTLTTSLPALTQTVFVTNTATTTSWMTSACSASGTFPTISASNGTTNGTSPAGETATTTATQEYLNVITTSCADPNAYYIQISAPGTEIDGTVAMGSMSQDDYGDMYMKPIESSSEWTPLPYTFDSETGYLHSYYNDQFTLAAYNYTQDGNDWRGMVESFTFGYGYASNLQCTLSDDDDKSLACGTLFDGVWHDMNKVVEVLHTDPARWFAYLKDTTYDGGQTAYDATFSLVGACDI